jgi:hypothetical protein
VSNSDADRRAHVAALATAKANELNWPWDPNALTIKRPPLGLAGTWRVTSYDEPDNATATLMVNERTGTVLPQGVVYRKRGGPTRDWAFFARRMAFGAAGAALAYMIATRVAGMSMLMSLPIALAAFLVSALVSIRFEKIPGT